MSYRFAAFLSDLQYLFSFRDRWAVTRNLKNIVPPDEDIRPLVRDVFRNFGRYLIEFFQMREMVDAEFIREKVRIEGLEHLDRALEKGKGGIVVTAHIGNWELGAVILSALGYPMMAIALPHKERPVNDLFNEQRLTQGVTVVRPRGALRHCMNHLRDNKVVALVADRDFGKSGIPMDFMGRRMVVPKGPAMFALKTGAPILPIFLVRNGNGTFTLSCSEPIEPPARCLSTESREAMEGIMRKYLSVIEEKVHAFPSQWLLFREFAV